MKKVAACFGVMALTFAAGGLQDVRAQWWSGYGFGSTAPRPELRVSSPFWPDDTGTISTPTTIDSYRWRRDLLGDIRISTGLGGDSFLDRHVGSVVRDGFDTYRLHRSSEGYLLEWKRILIP